MSNAKHATPYKDLLVISAGGDLSPQVVRGLREKQFTLRLEQGFPQLEKQLTNLKNTIVIVEAGPRQNAVAAAVAQLELLSQRYQFPVLLLGDKANEYERNLSQCFTAATTLDIPYDVAEILAGVNYLSRTFRDYLRRSGQQVTSASVERVPEPTHTQATPPAEPPPPPLAAQLFDSLRRLDVLSRTMGGRQLACGEVNLEFLDSSQMLPTNAEVLELVHEISSAVGEWGAAHLARTSYVAQKTIDTMSPEETLRENLKAAAFLYAWSIAEQSPKLLKAPHHGTGGASAKSEFSMRVSESAETVSSSLGMTGAGEIISEVGRLLRGDNTPRNDEISVTASAIMFADKINRTCFQDGQWNPRRAYSLLTSLKLNGTQEIHPAVLGCGVKMVAEGLAARTHIVLLPKELREDKAFLEKLKREREAAVGKSEQKIPICSLAPGMRLSKPLISIDGKEILSPDMTLDEDLIWRIWQIAAIKPVRSAVVQRPDIAASGTGITESAD